MGTLDKATATLDKPQYHLRLAPGDVARWVLLPGDPDRVLRIAKYLDDAREMAFHREHRTWTGSYKGIPVSVLLHDETVDEDDGSAVTLASGQSYAYRLVLDATGPVVIKGDLVTGTAGKPSGT